MALKRPMDMDVHGIPIYAQDFVYRVYSNHMFEFPITWTATAWSSFADLYLYMSIVFKYLSILNALHMDVPTLHIVSYCLHIVSYWLHIVSYCLHIVSYCLHIVSCFLHIVSYCLHIVFQMQFQRDHNVKPLRQVHSCHMLYWTVQTYITVLNRTTVLCIRYRTSFSSKASSYNR